MGWFSWLFKKTPAPVPTGHDIELPAKPVAVRSPSDTGIKLIQRQEGCLLVAYLDVDGVYVIGYGCKMVDGKQVVKGQTIDAKGADRVCRQHAQVCATAILPLVHILLTQGQLDALVDFVYNIGLAALQQSTLLRFINSGQQVTERLFTMWNKIHKNGVVVELPALTLRRKAEYQLWIS